MNKEEELQKIAEEIERCALCRKGGTGKAVPGEGSPDAQVMFVGEAPGKPEAKTGKPFISRSGKFLRGMIRSAGLDEEKIFITSPVHYLPVTGRPSPAMIEHGRTHLVRQIRVIKPRIIVLLGNTACRAVLEQNIPVAGEHGTCIEKDGITHLITLHPAYAARFPDGKQKFTADFEKLKYLLDCI